MCLPPILVFLLWGVGTRMLKIGYSGAEILQTQKPAHLHFCCPTLYSVTIVLYITNIYRKWLSGDEREAMLALLEEVDRERRGAGQVSISYY